MNALHIAVVGGSRGFRSVTLEWEPGVVRHAQGQPDEAVRWCKAVLQHDPLHGWARAYLVDILGSSDADGEAGPES